MSDLSPMLANQPSWHPLGAACFPLAHTLILFRDSRPAHSQPGRERRAAPLRGVSHFSQGGILLLTVPQLTACFPLAQTLILFRDSRPAHSQTGRERRAAPLRGVSHFSQGGILHLTVPQLMACFPLAQTLILFRDSRPAHSQTGREQRAAPLRGVSHFSQGGISLLTRGYPTHDNTTTHEVDISLLMSGYLTSHEVDISLLMRWISHFSWGGYLMTHEGDISLLMRGISHDSWGGYLMTHEGDISLLMRGISHFSWGGYLMTHEVDISLLMRWISHFSWGGYLTSHEGDISLLMRGISHFSQYLVPNRSDANSIPRLTPRAFSTSEKTSEGVSHFSWGGISLFTIPRLTGFEPRQWWETASSQWQRLRPQGHQGRPYYHH